MGHPGSLVPRLRNSSSISNTPSLKLKPSFCQTICLVKQEVKPSGSLEIMCLQYNAPEMLIAAKRSSPAGAYGCLQSCLKFDSRGHIMCWNHPHVHKLEDRPTAIEYSLMLSVLHLTSSNIINSMMAESLLFNVLFVLFGPDCFY